MGLTRPRGHQSLPEPGGSCSLNVSPVDSVLNHPLWTKFRRFADDSFICIFVTEKFCILIKISLKFVPKDPIENNPAPVQIMAWQQISASHYLNQCWPSSLTHICGTRGRWIKPVISIAASKQINVSTGQRNLNDVSTGLCNLNTCSAVGIAIHHWALRNGPF